MIGIVLVSHSAALADGLAEMADQIAGGDVSIIGAGGGPDGTLGTTGDRIVVAHRCADSGGGVLVLADLGSAILSGKAVASRGLTARGRCSQTPRHVEVRSQPPSESIGLDLDATTAAEEAWSVGALTRRSAARF